MRKSAALFVMAALIAIAADPADDRFDSDNKATTVRPPVIGGPRKSYTPVKVKADKAALDASDVKGIAAKQGKDSIVAGTVQSTHVPNGAGMVLLNFGRDHRSCFKVVIRASDFEKWGLADATAVGKLYEGKKVQVSGIVTMYQNLPQIAVNAPEQIAMVTP